MHVVYVIQSLKNEKRYVGFTRKSAEARLTEHNRGCNVWSRHNKPFTLIYAEIFVSLHEATRRERFLKSGKGREYLQSIIPR